MTYLQVAIGIIVDDGRILVTRRKQGTPLAGHWEFPGGKLLEQESASECLHREVMEELGIAIRVMARLAPTSHDYGPLKVTLHPFIVALESGVPMARASDELRWVTLEECLTLDFPAANAPLLAQLQPVLRSLGIV